MKTGWIAILAALCLVLPAVAQDRPGAERPGRRGMMRRGGPGRGGGPGMMLNRMAQRMAEELELDEEQEAELDEIIADFREEFTEMRGPSPEMRELFEEMRAARRDGDEERAQELREQLRGMRGGSPMAGLMDDFYAEVETILDEQQRGKLAEFRERMTQRMRERGRRGDRGPDMRRLIRSLPERLELDQDQRARFDELTAELRGQGDARRQRWEEMRPLIEEMRQARRDGDDERVEELRRQIEEQRGANNPFEAFFAELEGILREDQKAILAEIRQDLGRRGARTRQADLRTILQAIKRVDLDKEQSQQVRAIGAQAMRASRELQRGDREARTQLARDTRQAIVEVLRPEQVRQFERALRSERPQRDMRDRDREDRPP